MVHLDLTTGQFVTYGSHIKLIWIIIYFIEVLSKLLKIVHTFKGAFELLPAYSLPRLAHSRFDQIYVIISSLVKGIQDI